MGEPAVTEKHLPAKALATRRSALIGTYVLAAAVGYAMGATGLFGTDSATLPGTPLARVGLALQTPNTAINDKEWAQLSQDIEVVRAALKAEQRGVFDLVATLRGIHAQGVSDSAHAEQVCRALHWQYCDPGALRDYRLQGRP